MTTGEVSFPQVAMAHDDALSDELDGEWTKLYRPTASPPLMPWPPRRTSLSSSYRPDHDPFTRSARSADLLDARSSDSSRPTTAHDPSSHSVAPRHCASRHRTSILSVASDALGFRKKIGAASRKKPSPLPSPRILPGVIEINNTAVTSSPHKDVEHEERERLRDVAAQSIGLDPVLLHASRSQSRSFLDAPESTPQPAPLPPFPATLFALRPFMELSATLPKFAPPSSLLIYALAKQWKSRTIVLTSHSAGRKTHVHLFKNTSKDDKELERLEVTEHTVIFVAEEEVGGRGNVVKLAAKDVSSKHTAATGDDDSRTMWLLQIKDPVESHRWIAAIKNAVLTQRAVRVGLDVPAQMDGGNEPKGDMDVMLSMHLQRVMSAHPSKTSPPSPLMPASPSPCPSLRSLKMNTSSTNAMKCILSGTRPRSPSVEGSSPPSHPPGHTEDSFSAVGTSLLTMLRTKSSTDSSSSPSHSLPLPPSHGPRQRSPAPSLRSTNTPVILNASDLKISKERDTPEVSIFIPEVTSSNTTPGSTNPPTPSLSPQGTLSFSLQPPPRKSKHAVAAVPTTLLPDPQEMYKQAAGNRSVAGNFGIPPGNSGDVTPRETPPVSPDSGEQSDEARRSLSGNGTGSSPGGGSVPADRAAVTKRWSRQGVPLPKQLTPPSGPPPSIPPSPENDRRFSVESGISIPVPYHYTLDRSPSSSSSNVHSRPGISPRSGTSLSPTFWKRASACSTFSASSAHTSDSQGQYQPLAPSGGDAFRSSVGSVVGNGASSRPMSLSLYGSSPVVPFGTAKRRSMPPPRPAPNFAPPPAPTVQESTSGPASLATPAPAPQKSFRSSVAQRALRLSLTSPKPPPSSALPPRPDEDQGHRRSSSSGTIDMHTISAPSSRPASPFSKRSNSIQRASSPPRSLSIRQRLRILSTPPIQPSPSIPSIHVSTLDLSDDNDDELPTPYLTSSQPPFGLGEPIMTMQSDPSFLQLSSPITPTTPKPPPPRLSRPLSPSLAALSGGLRTPPLEPDCDFVALSPPPPRRNSKPNVLMVPRPERLDVERPRSAHREESKLMTLSQGGSVVSLGFVTR